jgi:hypothetical protein
MNKGNINTNDNNNVSLENIFEELDVPFTEAELDKCVQTAVNCSTYSLVGFYTVFLVYFQSLYTFV